MINKRTDKKAVEALKEEPGAKAGDSTAAIKVRVVYASMRCGAVVVWLVRC